MGNTRHQLIMNKIYRQKLNVVLSIKNVFDNVVRILTSGIENKNNLFNNKDFKIVSAKIYNNLITGEKSLRAVLELPSINKRVVIEDLKNKVAQSGKGDPNKAAKVANAAMSSLAVDMKRVKNEETKKLLNNLNDPKNASIVIAEYLKQEAKFMNTLIDILKTIWNVVKLLATKVWNFLTKFFTQAKGKVDTEIQQVSQKGTTMQNTANKMNTKTSNVNKVSNANIQNQNIIKKYILEGITLEPEMEEESAQVVKNVNATRQNIVQNKSLDREESKWEIFKNGILGALYRLIMAVVFNGLLMYMMKAEGMEVPSFIYEKHMLMEESFGETASNYGKGLIGLFFKGINFLFGGFLKKSWGVMVHFLNSQNINSVIMVLFAVGYFYQLFYFIKDVYLSMKYIVIT